MNIVLVISSLLITAFGQPAMSAPLSFLASIIGVGLFFFALSAYPAKKRFWYGTAWYAVISFIQLRWFVSQPYFYIWIALALLSCLLGLQFGIICLFSSKKDHTSKLSLFILPALWTLFEWSRLFLLSGYTFNPMGLTLTWSTHALLCAQFFGIYGLSFWVMLTNTLFSRMLSCKTAQALSLWLACASIPFFCGTTLLSYHKEKMTAHDALHPPIAALLVDIQKLPEELASISAAPRKNPVDEAHYLWNELTAALSPYEKQKIDLIVFPEVTIPIPATRPIFSNVFFAELFGETHPHLIHQYSHSTQEIAQKIARRFHATVVMGLEGEVYNPLLKRYQSTNSAFVFSTDNDLAYHKQVLVPLGEYIPCAWIKPLAEEYGLYDSWLQGLGPSLYSFSKGVLSPSICYEETFCTIMRHNAKGATLLVNLTNDGWFPDSSLARQHLEHARPRTCENGVPLIRACNYGVSCAIDSLGRTITEIPSIPGISCAVAHVSSYTYSTLYQKWGDTPLLTVATVSAVYGLARRRKDRKCVSSSQTEHK